MALSLANWATRLAVGASALQLCNGRLGIGCFLMKNDAECYALCSHRPGCSVPLKGCVSKVPQLRTERGAAQSIRFDFLVSNLASGSHAFSGDVQFGVLDSVQVLGFGWRRRGVAIFSPGSAHVAAGPLNPPTLWVRQVGSC